MTAPWGTLASGLVSREVESSCRAIEPLNPLECRHGEKGAKAGVRGQLRPLIRGARENGVGVIPCVRT